MDNDDASLSLRLDPVARRLVLLVFVSGFCSLVYQVAWFRLLRLIFGASTAANAAAVAIFMAGLGIGGFWLGRRAARSANSMALYSKIELGIALAACLSPWLADLGRAVYLGLGGSSGLGTFGAAAVRLLLSTLVIGGSTTLMGGTLPAATQSLQSERDRSRRWVARLYGVNTLGAVSGAFFATFYSIELLGIRQSLWLAGAVNLLIAVAARSLSRDAFFQRQTDTAGTPQDSDAPRDEDGKDEAEAEAEPHKNGGRGDEGRALSPRARFLLPAAALVGFVFFLMELVWYRMLAPVLGGSSYTFGLILGIALLGIGLGSLIYGRKSESRTPTFTILAVTCGLEALFLILPFAAGDLSALLAVVTRPMVASGFWGLVSGWMLVVIFIVLPPAMVAGYQFPLLVGLIGRGTRNVGYEVGLVYAWNTAGAILGSLAGGFGLLPLLGAERLWRASALFLVVLGAAVLFFARRFDDGPGVSDPEPSGGSQPHKIGRLLPIGLLLLPCLFVFADGPTAFWRHTAIGAGRVPAMSSPNELKGFLNTVQRGVVDQAEGVESAVALVRDNDLALIVNGKSDGSARGDAATNVMSAMIGTALHENPKKVLIIGLGTGVTAGWFAQVPSVEQVDVVELEPSVVRFADQFAAVNFDAMNSPKVRLIYGDGREWIQTHAESYDVIFSEPSNPYRVGVADLFSQDFYRSVTGRLNPGGIFLQWLQGYDVDPEVIQGCYATLVSVFPSVETWRVHAKDLLLVATTESLIHPPSIADRVEQEPWRTALREVWGVDGLAGFYSGFVADHRLALALAAGSSLRVSTDDRPTIEFGFARNVGATGVFELAKLQNEARRLRADRPPVALPLDHGSVAELAAAREAEGAFASAGAGRADAEPQSPATLLQGIAAARQRSREAWSSGRLAAAAGFWPRNADREPMPPHCFLDHLLTAELEAGGFFTSPDGEKPSEESRATESPDDQLPALRFEQDPELERDAVVERLFLRSWAAQRRGDIDGAGVAMIEAIHGLREDPWVNIPLVERGLQRAKTLADQDPELGARLFAALEHPFAARIFEEARLAARLNLAARLDFSRFCVGAFEGYEPYPLWNRRFLEKRLECYRGSGHAAAERAERELAELVQHDRGSFSLDAASEGTP